MHYTQRRGAYIGCRYSRPGIRVPDLDHPASAAGQQATVIRKGQRVQRSIAARLEFDFRHRARREIKSIQSLMVNRDQQPLF